MTNYFLLKHHLFQLEGTITLQPICLANIPIFSFKWEDFFLSLHLKIACLFMCYFVHNHLLNFLIKIFKAYTVYSLKQVCDGFFSRLRFLGVAGWPLFDLCDLFAGVRLLLTFVIRLPWGWWWGRSSTRVHGLCAWDTIQLEFRLLHNIDFLREIFGMECDFWAGVTNEYIYNQMLPIRMHFFILTPMHDGWIKSSKAFMTVAVLGNQNLAGNKILHLKALRKSPWTFIVWMNDS